MKVLESAEGGTNFSLLPQPFRFEAGPAGGNWLSRLLKTTILHFHSPAFEPAVDEGVEQDNDDQGKDEVEAAGDERVERVLLLGPGDAAEVGLLQHLEVPARRSNDDGGKKR